MMSDLFDWEALRIEKWKAVPKYHCLKTGFYRIRTPCCLTSISWLKKPPTRRSPLGQLFKVDIVTKVPREFILNDYLRVILDREYKLHILLREDMSDAKHREVKKIFDDFVKYRLHTFNSLLCYRRRFELVHEYLGTLVPT